VSLLEVISNIQLEHQLFGAILSVLGWVDVVLKW